MTATTEDIDRWHQAIRKHYEGRAEAYPEAALGWRLLYSPVRVLEGASVAFLGLNPGGRAIREDHGEFSTEAGSAYSPKVEDWGKSGKLQGQVLALFERLAVAPEDVLAGNLVPFRSPSEAEMVDAEAAIAFGRSLWAEIFQKVRPKITVTMGKTTNREVSDLLKVQGVKNHPVNWGAYTVARGEFEGGTWIGLPHLSQFKIMKRAASQAALDAVFHGLS